MKTQKNIYDARFLKKFTLAIIQTVESQKFNIPPTKEIINADLIPELSEELLREYELNNKFLQKIEELNNDIDNTEEIEKIEYPIQKTIISPLYKKQQKTLIQPQLQTQTPGTDTTPGYQKIQPLLRDPSVSRIQCSGPNKPLMIIRTGQKQITRIILSPTQIKDIFQEIAEQAHIPLIEGPFKVALKELTINGIHSKMTNPQFIIQKQTAYSLLEKRR